MKGAYWMKEEECLRALGKCLTEIETVRQFPKNCKAFSRVLELIFQMENVFPQSNTGKVGK